MSAPAGCRERRLNRRRTEADAHGIVAAQVRPGRGVRVIDISAGGALVETSHRLLPGVVIDLQLEMRDGRVIVRGRILRCSVARLQSSGVWYRGAIQFERYLAGAISGDGYELPRGDG